MFQEDERPRYKKMSDDKKDRLKDLFFTEEYKKNQKKRKATQKRKEKVAKFGIVGFIIAINVILFLPQWISPSLTEWMFSNLGQGGIMPGHDYFQPFKIWQPLTAMWLHGGFIHLAINMVVLWSFGKPLQKIWGNKKLFITYLLSGIGGSLLMLAFSAFHPYSFGVGASGAICGLFGAMAVIAPDSKIHWFFIFPARTDKSVMWFGIISLFLAVTGFLPVVGHAAHLGGLVVGYLIALYWKKRGNLYTTFI